MALRNPESRSFIFQEERYDPVQQIQQKQVFEYENKKKEEAKIAADTAELINNTADTWKSMNAAANDSYTYLVQPYMKRQKEAGRNQALSEVNAALNYLKGIESVGKELEAQLAEVNKQSLNNPNREGYSYNFDKSAEWQKKFNTFGYADLSDDEKRQVYNTIYTPDIKALYGENNPKLQWALDLKAKELYFYNEPANFFEKKDIRIEYAKKLSEGKKEVKNEGGLYGTGWNKLASTTTSTAYSEEDYNNMKNAYFNNEEVINLGILEYTTNQGHPIKDMDELKEKSTIEEVDGHLKFNVKGKNGEVLFSFTDEDIDNTNKKYFPANPVSKTTQYLSKDADKTTGGGAGSQFGGDATNSELTMTVFTSEGTEGDGKGNTTKISPMPMNLKVSSEDGVVFSTVKTSANIANMGMQLEFEQGSRTDLQGDVNVSVNKTGILFRNKSKNIVGYIDGKKIDRGKGALFTREEIAKLVKENKAQWSDFEASPYIFGQFSSADGKTKGSFYGKYNREVANTFNVNKGKSDVDFIKIYDYLNGRTTTQSSKPTTTQTIKNESGIDWK